MSDPIEPLTPVQEAAQEAKAAHENPILTHILVPLDQFTSEITGGPADETISTRLAIDAVDGHGLSKDIGDVGSKLLDEIQRDHGAKAGAGDIERALAEEAIVEKSGID